MKNMIELGEKTQANTSRDNDFRADPKNSLFHYLYNEIRIFFGSALKSLSLEVFAWFFFSFSIIFFCFRWVIFDLSEPSGSVRKKAKTEKKLNESTKNFQGRAGFFVLRDFSFFFFMSSIKLSLRISNWFFSTFGAWHPKTSPKKKGVHKQTKKRH